MSGKIDNMQKVLAAFLPDYGAKLHVREIARTIKMNRQTASETLKEMEHARILDSEIAGRNTLYFINKSSQKAKILMVDAENSRKMDICSRKREISRLVEHLDTTAVTLLFGSYAKGTERESSDIDVMLIGGGKKPDLSGAEIGAEIQVLDMSEKQFLNRLAKKNHVAVEVAQNHVCLKNTERFVDLMWRANYG